MGGFQFFTIMLPWTFIYKFFFNTCFYFSWSACLFWNTLSFAYYDISDFVSIYFLLCFLIHIPVLGLLLYLSSCICILVLIICCMQLTQVYISSLEFLRTELYIYLTSAIDLIWGVLKSSCPEVLWLFTPLNLVLSHFSLSYAIRS